MVERYPASTLIKRAGKGGKYYVCVTIPEPLRKGTQRQMMRSTGTSDLRIAKTRQHAKTAEIYAELDRRQEKIYREYSQDGAVRRILTRLKRPGQHHFTPRRFAASRRPTDREDA